jgi:hypothetical protein
VYYFHHVASILGRTDHDAFCEEIRYAIVGCLLSYLAMVLLLELYLCILGCLATKELDIALCRLASIRTPSTREELMDKLETGDFHILGLDG